MAFLKYRIEDRNKLIEFTDHAVAWIDHDKDFDLIYEYYATHFDAADIVKSDFGEPILNICAALIEGSIASFACAMRLAEESLEIGAVSTAPDQRNRGYSKAVVSAVARSILESGKAATLTTREENIAMQRVALQIGMELIGVQDKL